MCDIFLDIDQYFASKSWGYRMVEVEVDRGRRAVFCTPVHSNNNNIIT